MNSISQARCHLCGANGDILYQGLSDSMFHVAGEWNLVQCQNHGCGLAWLDPQPEASLLNQLYQNYHTHQPKTVRPALLTGLLKKVYKLFFLNLRRGGLVASSFADRRAGRLLDVGCGGGEFMWRMQRKGWEVEGIDIDAKAVRAARENYGLNARVGLLEEAGYQESSFDVIVLKHVIEHVYEPEAMLRECLRVLRPGGLMVSITPNINSYGRRRFGKNWRGLEPPRHVYIYTPESAKTLAGNAGFGKVDVFTSGANAVMYYFGSLSGCPVGAITRTASVFRYLRAVLFRLREALLLKRNPEMGEEIVVRAVK